MTLGSPLRSCQLEKPLPVTQLILAALGFGERGGAIYGSGVEMGSGSGPIKKPETH